MKAVIEFQICIDEALPKLHVRTDELERILHSINVAATQTLYVDFGAFAKKDDFGAFDRWLRHNRATAQWLSPISVPIPLR